MADPTRCLFCDHALDGRSKKFCTTCLPPLGEWADKREYHKQYMILRCAVGIGTEGMERCRIPKDHGAYVPPPPMQGPPKPRVCSCGAVLFIGTGSYCAPCRATLRAGVILRYHASQAAQRPDDWTPTNSRQRSDALRRRRKAARRSGTRPTVAKLADRDGWRCHICGKRIDATLTGTKSKYKASIDHLVPLSDDGPDEMWNCKLAHLRCNSKRGAGGVVQLALPA